MKFKHPKTILSICNLISTGGWISLVYSWESSFVIGFILSLMSVTVSDIIQISIWWDSE
jgi:hypothetical protein